MNGNSYLYAAIVGGLLPLVTALLTKANTVVRTKASVAAVLSWVGGILVAVGTDTFDAKGTASTIITTFLALAASYQNGWKPLGVVGGPDQPGVIDRATARVGI